MTTQTQSEKDRVYIFDTTLRDGEQSPGATMTHEEKLEVADLLDENRGDLLADRFAPRRDGLLDRCQIGRPEGIAVILPQGVARLGEHAAINGRTGRRCRNGTACVAASASLPRLSKLKVVTGEIRRSRRPPEARIGGRRVS